MSPERTDPVASRYLTLADRLVVISGASSGIGAEIARHAAMLGARISLIGRDETRLNATLSSLEGNGHEFYATDLADLTARETVIDSIVARQGRIAGLVHAAGAEITLPLRSLRAEHYESLFGINALAAFELTRHCARKQSCDENGASFVYLASVMATSGQPGNAAYCASKGALVSGMRALALEMAPRRIRINTISPGIVETPMSREMFSRLPEPAINAIRAMHPLGLGHPDDVAALAVFLLSDRARWITGSDFVCDGGYSAS